MLVHFHVVFLVLHVEAIVVHFGVSVAREVGAGPHPLPLVQGEEVDGVKLATLELLPLVVEEVRREGVECVLGRHGKGKLVLGVARALFVLERGRERALDGVWVDLHPGGNGASEDSGFGLVGCMHVLLGLVERLSQSHRALGVLAIGAHVHAPIHLVLHIPLELHSAHRSGYLQGLIQASLVSVQALISLDKLQILP